MAETLTNTGKRKGRKAAEQPADAAMVEPGAFKSQVAEVIRLRTWQRKAAEEQRKANSVLRTAIKTLKKLGKSLDMTEQAITWYLENEERDPAEIDRETRERNKIAKFMGLPVGGMLGLFEDGESVATAAENAEFDTMESIERAGFQAQREGLPRDDNPNPDDPAKEAAWDRGWNRALQGIGETMEPKAKRNGAAPEQPAAA